MCARVFVLIVFLSKVMCCLACFIVLSMCLLIEMNAETKTCAMIAVSMRKVCACMCAYCVCLSHAATCLSIACEKGCTSSLARSTSSFSLRFVFRNAWDKG